MSIVVKNIKCQINSYCFKSIKIKVKQTKNSFNGRNLKTNPFLKNVFLRRKSNRHFVSLGCLNYETGRRKYCPLLTFFSLKRFLFFEKDRKSS